MPFSIFNLTTRVDLVDFLLPRFAILVCLPVPYPLVFSNVYRHIEESNLDF